jgi:DNA-binding PadR family transcriptional regulator
VNNLTVKHALLGLLARKPGHGYELKASFEAVAGGDANWDVKPAQVYATLERLSEAGLVRCTSELGQGEEPSRRVYAITPQGQQALQDWFDCAVEPEHQRDEFYIKLMVALVSGAGDPYTIIKTQRTLIFQRLHEATYQRSSLDHRRELAQMLISDKAIMHLEADLHWLNIVEGRLEELKRQPQPKIELRPRGRPKKSTSAGD